MSFSFLRLVYEEFGTFEDRCGGFDDAEKPGGGKHLAIAFGRVGCGDEDVLCFGTRHNRVVLGFAGGQLVFDERRDGEREIEC